MLVDAQELIDGWIGGPLTLNENEIQTWLNRAERLIRRRVPNLMGKIRAERDALAAGRIEKDEALYEDSVKDVIIAVATRVFQNPSGRRTTTEGTGPYSQTVTYGGDNPGTLYLTDDELDDLRQTKRGQAFSIDTVPVRRSQEGSYLGIPYADF